MSTGTPAATASVSTHILDTTAGRPARGVPVTLSVRTGGAGQWRDHGASRTDADGRCRDLPALPESITHARLVFETADYFESGDRSESGVFFPEVAVAFAVAPGAHYHVPLLLNPFGYSVYRGS
ncbi:hydroxyisourate hydrolase [Streptomyces sp. NPDC050610]|uniref:hydroxyisourate hydrolase n=1 Tax=Streptomyces sp. NPDC050610 TaxID=3157097 RepID=UPI003415FB0B